MVFVGLWIFTSRLTHVYVTSSASELKEKRSCNSFHLALYARMVRMDIDEKEMIAHYHRKCFKRKLLKLSAKEIARHIYILFGLRKLQRVHYHPSLSNAPHVFVHGKV